MRRPILLALLVAVPVGLAALVLFVGNGGEGRGERTPPVSGAEAPTFAEEPEVAELIPPPVVRSASGPVTTTVLWPVKVELELLEARFLPRQEGVPPVGSGAGARLSGQIMAAGDVGAQAEIRFVAGANAGRVLPTDVGGRFGATDLYPGLSVVEVRGPTILGSRRQVRLRRGQEALLNIGYGRPGAVFGRVQDASGTGLEGARVVIDGTQVITDGDGGFYLGSVAAGTVLCEVEHEGFARYEELVAVAGGQTMPKERMTFTLKPAAELRVVVQGNAGGPGPAWIYVFSDRPEYTSASAYRNESYPWHKVNPVQAFPGTPVTISGLRPEIVKVHVFRPGARALVKTVNLATSLRDIVMELRPAPTLTGTVLERGQPVFGAKVKLEAPDRVRATLGYFTEPSYFLETAVIPNLPPGLQETTTDAQGRFVLSAWADTSPVRYLEARGPGGGTWAGRFVRPEDQNVRLELGAVDLGESTLLVDFPGRHQGLPVELWIGGAPSATSVLGPEEDLEVSNLVAGRWKIAASWHGAPLQAPAEIEIEDVQRHTIALLPECIQGQTEEQWRRAGRPYPHGP